MIIYYFLYCYSWQYLTPVTANTEGAKPAFQKITQYNVSSYVVIHWSGISSCNILWLHSSFQSVLCFLSGEFSGNAAMLIALSLEKLSSEDGFSQQLAESNIAFALNIAEPLAKNKRFWEEMLHVLYLLSEEEGKE